MDCTRAQEIISASHDEDVAASELAEARSHCGTCPECHAFEEALKRLASVPGPSAPESLISGIRARTDALAGERAAALSDRQELLPDEIDLGAHIEPPIRPKAWWVPRFTAAAVTVAAVLAVALVTRAGIVMITGSRTDEAGERARRPTQELADSAKSGAATPEVSALRAPSGARIAADAPDYVVFGIHVYVAVTASADRSALTTVGTVSSALDSETEPASSRTVLQVAGQPDTIYVEESDGDLLGFRLVTRRFAGRDYALNSDPVIDRFGQWPALPSRIPPPAATDGSPTFQQGGVDERGMRVYRFVGMSEDAGFAIAPDSPAGDPAAGNPNWTWWTPVSR